LPPQPVFSTYSHPNYLLPRGSGYFSSQSLSPFTHILKRSHASYLLTYEDGADSVFQNVGI
jgi:hypothetical protein